MKFRFVLTAALCFAAVVNAFAADEPKIPAPPEELVSLGASSSPRGFVELDGYAYFFATTNDEGQELWRTDGTSAGTTMVKAIRPDVSSSHEDATNPVVLNGAVYFTATDTGIPQLWKTDGTEAGTVKVSDLPSGTVRLLERAGNLLFLTMNPGVPYSSTTDVWRSDGTEAGTFLVKTINSYSGVTQSASFGNRWIFVDPYQDIWSTDGTVAGTIDLGFEARTDVKPAVTSSGAFFAGYGNGLWKTDGATAEQVETGSSITRIVAMGDAVYFVAVQTQLWKTTGAVSGAVMLRDFSADYTHIGYTCYYSGPCGSIRDILSASDRIYVVAGTSYYTPDSGYTYLSGGYDLWKSSGTAAGTVKVAALPYEDSYTGYYGLTVGTRVYFPVYQRLTGIELWTSDGTEAGTGLVKEIAEGTFVNQTTYGYSSNPTAFGAFGSKLLFQANDRIHGFEVWQSDGSAAGTTLVKNINPEGIITGRVYDAGTDAAVTSAVVMIYARNSSNVPELIKSYPVDADGVYTIEGLPTLTYYLRVTNSESYLDQTWNGRVCFPCSIAAPGDGIFIVSPDTITDVDFALTKGGTISGHVTNGADNTPVSGLRVFIGTQYGSSGAVATTDANGDYATTVGLPDGKYAVYTEATVYSGKIYDNISCAAGCTPGVTAFTAVTVTGTTNVSGIDFSVLPLGVITGKVTDAVTGEALKNVNVAVYSRDKEMTTSSGYAVATASTSTAADGTYTLTVKDGTYSLLFSRTSYTSKFWPNTSCTTCTTHAGTAVVPVPGSTTTYDATLQPKGGRIRGSVKELAGGAPVANLTLFLYTSTGYSAYSAATQTDGTFAFEPQIPSGTYYLETQFTYSSPYVPEIWDGVNGKACKNCAVTTGTKLVINGTTVIDNVNFLLEKFGSIRAKTYDAVTSAAVSGRLILTDASGNAAGDSYNSQDALFTNVYPGTYYMHTELWSSEYPNVYYGGAAYCNACPGIGGTAITVTAGTETTVNFPLKTYGHVVGRVTDGAGNPITSARIEVWMPNASYYDAYDYADWDGNFDVRAFGNVIVKANATGYATEAHNGAECPDCQDIPLLAVDAGTTKTVNFVLGPSAHITGTVTDAIGAVPGEIDLELYDSRGNKVLAPYAWYGSFNIPVGAGTYYLHSLSRMPVDTGYSAATYKAQNCATFCKDKALAITVTSGGTATISVPVTGIAKITGTITNIDTSAGIANVPIVVWDLIGNKLALNVTSTSNGTYSASVPIGKYAVYTNSNAYYNKVWNGVACNGACVPSAGTNILARDTYPQVNIALKARPAAPRDSYLDTNADGKSEIVWRSGTGLFTIWEMSGRTLLNSQTITTLADANWKVLGFGDFDGDGDDDFFFRNSVNGGTAMWLMDGKTITLNAPSTPVADMKWQMHAIGDFNGDGKDELIWRNTTTGVVAMWEMNGVTLVNGANFYTVSDLNWEIVLAADFTGDKKDEILWRNKSTGALAMWELNGRTLINGASFATVSDLTWKIIATGDYNGDGKADLLWRQSSTNLTAMWEMNGRTVTDGRSLITVGSAWVIEHCGDFNADKKDEILWRNTATGQVAMWETNGHTLLNTAVFATVSDLNTKMQPRGGVRPALDSQ